MRKTLVVAIAGALAAGAMVGGATIALAQADVVKERQENRKQAGAAMRAIKGVIEGPVETACPASILRNHGDAHLYIDRDSASLLSR